MEEHIPKSRRKAAVCRADECGESACGGCACAGWYCPSQFHLLRWLLGLIIIVFVFWCGMKIGELKSDLIGGGFERRAMYNRFDAMPAQRMMILDAKQYTPIAPAPVKDSEETKR